ncbi:MAG TPA: glycosyltransferase [Marmoricola sp.]|nr:glycosyltransferase [Marmoricola sp.]
MLPITVVLPVYHRVEPEHFDEAFASVMGQTSPVAEVIVVADGPLPDALDSRVVRAVDNAENASLLRLEENQGVAIATNLALEAASQPWFARQDADDISLPRRFELSWERLERGDLAGLGGALLEFEGEPSNVVATRRLPGSVDEVARYVRVNSPINNPTSVVNTEAARKVGGIRPVHLMEDYDLFARLIAGGYRLENLEDPLVLFRSDPDMFKRRRDMKLYKAEWVMQANLRRYGLISWPRSLINLAVRIGVRLLPNSVFVFLHKRVFRDADSSKG